MQPSQQLAEWAHRPKKHTNIEHIQKNKKKKLELIHLKNKKT